MTRNDKIRHDEQMEILALLEIALPQFKTSQNPEEVAKLLGRRIIARMPNPMLAEAFKRVFEPSVREQAETLAPAPVQSEERWLS